MAWGRRVDAVWRLGFAGVHFRWTLTEVVMPCLATLLDAVLLPRFVANVPLPLAVTFLQRHALFLHRLHQHHHHHQLLLQQAAFGGGALLGVGGDGGGGLGGELSVSKALTTLALATARLFPTHADGTPKLVELSPVQYAAARRLALPCYLALRCCLVAGRFAAKAFGRLHDQIRDDRYLLGLRLNNLHQPPKPTTPQPPPRAAP